MYNPKLKTLLVFILFLFSVNRSIGQALTQTIRGTVVDKQSQSPLFGANIIILNTEPLKGTKTDENGKFRLEGSPIGRQQVKVSYIGYREAVLQVLVTTGKELVLTIELEEAIVTKNEVVIVAQKDKSQSNNKMSTVSARSFDVEESNRYAGSRNDVSKMVGNYAGVTGGNDIRNDIIIRGNSPNGLLWRLEGVDIPNPNHFAAMGTTGGPIGMLNNNVLSNSDFMTGAFTADYGNALSGVFDLRMRNGNNEKYEYTGQIGLNGLELGAEGPISKKTGASFLGYYRFSTLKFLQQLGMEFGTGTGVPKYQDATFKINVPVKKGIISLFGVGGLSKISLLNSESEEKNIYADNSYDVVFGSTMGIAGLSYTRFINTNTYAKLTLSGSYEQNSNTVDSLDVNNDPHPFLRDQADRNKYAANFYISNKLSARLSAKSGIMVDVLGYNLINERFNPIENTFRTRISSDGSSFFTRAYTQWSYKITPDLSFNPGVNFLHFALNDKYAVEPRAGVSWDFSRNQRLSFGYGIHNKLQELPVYFVETQVGNQAVLTNKNLDFTQAQHFVLGYDLKINENMRLKTETYYQYLTRVPVQMRPNYFSMINAGSDFVLPLVDSLENKGTGENYGIELTLEKFFSNTYYFLVTTSLFESKYKGSDGIKRNSAFNINYVVNTLFGKEWKLSESSVLALDFKFTIAGGKPYIPIDTAASRIYKRTVFDLSNPFGQQFKEYIKPDIKLTFRMNSKKFSQEFAVSVENFTNQRNILSQQYNDKGGNVVTNYQLGIFPIALYKINF
ncbi:MAG: TonB-dependent receptor [Bacteroidia bacterium]